MTDLKNMNNDELIEWFATKATDEDFDNVEIQRIFVEKGLVDILVSSSLLITDKQVISGIIASDIWKERILIEGKINSIKDINNNDAHIKVDFEFIENHTNKTYHLIRDYGFKSIDILQDTLKQYNNLKAIYLIIDGEPYLDCFMLAN